MRPTILTFALLLLFCSSDNGTFSLFYSPVVTFSGYIDKEYASLPGYLEYPNSCELDGDTIKMAFYSTDYQPTTTPSGRLLRIWLLPNPNDSDTTTHTFLGTARLFMKFTDHTGGTTCSYEVHPGDTVRSLFSGQVEIETLDWVRNGTVALDEVTFLSQPMGAFCREFLEIEEGTISGRIE